MNLIANQTINFDKKNSKEDPKFKVGDHAKVSKQKNFFAKDGLPNWSEKAFVIIKVENTVLWTYVISDLNGEEIVAKAFHGKELEKGNKTGFRVE